MHLARARWSVAACLGTFVLGGCVGLTDFDPVGASAYVDGAWTIDGAAPSSASCEAIGATRVRVAFLDDLRGVAHGGLYFECPTGSFDTVNGSGKVVGDGNWVVRLEAIDAANGLVAVGDAQPHTIEGAVAGAACAADGDCPEGRRCQGAICEPAIRLGTIDFLSGVVSARFEVGGQTPSTTSCMEAGVGDVALVFDDLGTGRVTSMPVEPCAAGAVGTRALPGVTYRAHLRVLDASGAILAETAPEEVTATSGADAILNGGAPFDLGAL